MHETKRTIDKNTCIQHKQRTWMEDCFSKCTKQYKWDVFLELISGGQFYRILQCHKSLITDKIIETNLCDLCEFKIEAIERYFMRMLSNPFRTICQNFSTKMHFE